MDLGDIYGKARKYGREYGKHLFNKHKDDPNLSKYWTFSSTYIDYIGIKEYVNKLIDKKLSSCKPFIEIIYYVYGFKTGKSIVNYVKDSIYDGFMEEGEKYLEELDIEEEKEY